MTSCQNCAFSLFCFLHLSATKYRAARSVEFYIQGNARIFFSLKKIKHQLLKINDFAFCNDLLLLSAMCGRCNFNLARRRLCNVPAGLRPVYLNVYNNLICYNTFKTIQKHVSGFIRAITAHPNCYFNYCYVLLVPES